VTRAFTVALGLALIVVTVWWQMSEHRAREEHARRVAAEARAATAAPHAPVRGDSVERAPGSAVLADLARHPELIPYPGVEGGTMRFWPQESRVLPPRWVYEDGHVAGHALFEYTRHPDGTIVWKRLAAAQE
jgi:hypothetical protein